MINETGLCCNCKYKETCNMHKKNPNVKVIDCQRFEMNQETEKFYNALKQMSVKWNDWFSYINYCVGGVYRGAILNTKK